MNPQGYNQYRDGDTMFRGVDMRNAPNVVGPGIVSDAQNARFRFGKAETRGGITKFATIAPSYTFTWPITWPLAWTASLTVNLQGAEVFDDTNAQRWIISVANGLVWKCRPGEQATAVHVENEIIITGNVFLVQCFDVMLMFRENNQTPLVMEDVDFGFHEIEQTPSGTGTIVIPNAESGALISNRLLVPHDRDEIDVSDIGDYTRYLPTFNALRANAGTGDNIVRLMEFAETTLVVFKERSVMLVTNFTGDLSQIAMEPITKEYGLVGKKVVVVVGRDVWFLSRQGIQSFGLTAQNKIQPGNEPVSAPIQPLIDRINWTFAANAVAAYYDNKAYFAVPIDGSTTNNAVIVYDFVTQSWNGYDTGAALADVRAFCVFAFAGKERLFFFDNNGFLNLYEEGECDEIWNGTAKASQGIAFDLTTRGYGGGDGYKDFNETKVVLATWNPLFSIEAVFDDSNRTFSVVSNKTRSRTRYYKYGVAPFVASNANADHATEMREDYSMPFPLSGVYPNGSAGAGPGIVLNTMAVSTTNKSVRGHGVFGQVRVTNDQGIISIKSVSLNSIPRERRNGTEA